jgi:putative hemolysin
LVAFGTNDALSLLRRDDQDRQDVQKMLNSRKDGKMKRLTNLNIWVALAIFLAVTSTAGAMPNPAAVFCGEMGYKYVIRTSEGGGQYGVCIFPDGSECEEWTYYRKCHFPQSGNCNCPWPCPGRIIYVDDDANGLNNGSNWQNAYNFLQDALADANASPKPVEIRIAQGTYKPDQGVGIIPGDRKATFQLINGVTLKGGYVGFGESDPNVRDINQYETILSGDLAGNDIDTNDPFGLLDEPSRAENSYHVATASNTFETAMLSGFTISGGNTGYERPSSLKMYGAGMYNESGSPTLNGCTFTRNSAYQAGGGIYNSAGSPTFIDCTFNINSAGYGAGICNFDSRTQLIGCTFTHNSARSGGGISNTASSPNLTNCTFLGNSALGGGGMSNAQSNPILIDCIFTGNSAHSGGGMSDRSCRSTLIGCTFTDNSAQYGGGMHDSEGSPTLTNCTFGGNSADYGGGVHQVDNKAQVINCAFIGNLAGTGGGGASVFTYWGCQPTITNCTFYGNSAPSGSAVACYWWTLEHPSNLQILNSIFADDGNQIWNKDGSKIEISYSNVQRGWTAIYDPCEGLAWGMGNMDTDPCFVDPGRWINGNDPNQIVEPNDPNAIWIDGDYHLKSQAGRWDVNEGRWVTDEVTSPCIDAGDMSSPIGYEPFPNGGIINMGAYGGTAEASKSYFGQPVCETIVAGDIDGDCVVDFKDFALMVFHWLEEY